MTKQQPPSDHDAGWGDYYEQTVLPFWRDHVEPFQLERPHGIKLMWYGTFPENPRGLVLISPGRIEAALKYPEFIYELNLQGYAVALIDHRGQGFSDRLSPNPHNGHVHEFDDFVDDFAGFVRAVEQRWCGRLGHVPPMFLVAHSMGGAIASLYLSRYPHRVQRAVLSSPMFGIQTGGVPTWLAQSLASAGAGLNALLSPKKPWYFFGMTGYKEIPFADNDLSHSEARYHMFRKHYADHPEVQLGGPTFGWLAQALRATKTAIKEAHSIHIPVMVIEAGADTVVRADRLAQYVERLAHPASHLKRIKGAKHEIFIEADEYRKPAIEALLQWFAQGAEKRADAAPPTVDPCE